MCLSCGLVQQSPLPTEDALRAYYSHHYRTDYKKTYQPKNKHIYRAGIAAKHRIEFLISGLAEQGEEPLGITHLDVGAGGGEVVYAARKHGFLSIGIEPNHGYSEFARDAYGIEVQTRELSDVPAGSYQVVSMFHVLEHMPNPRAVFEALHALTVPGGYALIEVPNIEQADASPANIFFHAHLIYYSTATLLFAADEWFAPLRVVDNGNIRVLFGRRDSPKPGALPQRHTIDRTLHRLDTKGWIEYLSVGGGWRRPIQRLKRLPTELYVRKLTPLQTLEFSLSQ
jgi:2-polyprenyl-3-methyl-5-hydroxy-6-metoxy-1,4-benzoquinol methylase